MGVSDHHVSLKPLDALLWDCRFKTNIQVGEREREGGKTNSSLFVGMFVLGEPRAVILGICPAVEGERPVRPNSFEDEIWVTQKSQSPSPMGHFWGLKEEGMRKWKRRTQKGEQRYLGTFSATHTCAERGLLEHTPVYLCASQSWRRCFWVWERVCVWGTVHYGMWPRPPSEDWVTHISELLTSWSEPSTRYEQNWSLGMIFQQSIDGHLLKND